MPSVGQTACASPLQGFSLFIEWICSIKLVRVLSTLSIKTLTGVQNRFVLMGDTEDTHLASQRGPVSRISTATMEH